MPKAERSVLRKLSGNQYVKITVAAITAAGAVAAAYFSATRSTEKTSVPDRGAVGATIPQVQVTVSNANSQAQPSAKAVPGRKKKLDLVLPAVVASSTSQQGDAERTPSVSKRKKQGTRPGEAKDEAVTTRISPYSSASAYVEAFDAQQDLTDPPALIAVHPDAAAAWADLFGSTKWQGDSHWGIVTFDSTGRQATYTNGPGKAPGTLRLQFSYAEVYNIWGVIGDWSQSDGQRGWLSLIDIEADDEVGAVMSFDVSWGPDMKLQDKWIRLPEK